MGQDADEGRSEPDEIRRLVRELGEAAGARAATPGAVARLREFFGRRAWRGPGGSNRIVVLFNAERGFLVTGFQPLDEDAYVERQGGFWVHPS